MQNVGFLMMRLNCISVPMNLDFDVFSIILVPLFFLKSFHMHIGYVHMKQIVDSKTCI